MNRRYVLIGVAALLALLMIGARAVAKEPPGGERVMEPTGGGLAIGEPGLSFRYVETFGVTEQAYPADVQHLNRPNGLFIDAGDNLYVVEEIGARVLKYRTSDSAHLLSIGTAGLDLGGEDTFDNPQDVAVDSSGNIWVVDQHRTVQYDSSGIYQQELGDWWSAEDNTHFDTPRGIVFDNQGRMYVSDTENHRVQVYTLTVSGDLVYSTTIGVTGVSGDDNAHFNRPAQIAIDSSYRLYVSDVNNYRVQRCTYSAGWTCTPFHGTGSEGSGDNELSWAYGLGIDDNNNIYIADGNNSRIKKCNSDGDCSTFATGFDWPADVAVDSTDNVYISDWNDCTIHKYSSGGVFQSVFVGTSDVPYVPDATRLNAPGGIAVASDGSIYVTEDQGRRLVTLNTAGSQQWTVGTAGVWGDDNAHLGSIWAGPEGNLAIDAEGHIYVPDTGNNRVQVFNPDGTYLTTMGVTGEAGGENDHFHCPTGIAISPVNGDIYVADRCTHRVQIFDSDRVYKATLGVTYESGSDNAHFDGPRGVAVNADGNIYIADTDNHRVQVFDSNYVWQMILGTTGECNDDFDHFCKPSHIAAGADGNIYVVDQDNIRVQVFDSTSVYLTSIGGVWSSKIGQFQRARGVAVDSTGNVYVTDRFNHTIQKFAPGVPGWTQVNINGFGDKENSGGSVTLHTFDDRLYAGLWNEDGGQLWRTSDGTAWSQITDDGFGNTDNTSIELGAVLDGFLYAGTWNKTNGCEMHRSGDGLSWEPVKTNGFGDANNTGVGTMTTFEDYRYVSTYNKTSGTEIWRTSDGTTWSQANDDGFGDADNVMGWTMVVFEGRLYVGVQNFETGAEIWRSADGTTWEQVDENGSGDSHNQWPQMAILDDQLYVGFANDSTDSYTGTGTQIWRSADGETWERVVGDGFGDNTNGGSDVLVAFDQALYSATYNPETGTQLHRTADGLVWTKVAPDGFGDPNNASTYGSAIFDNHLFLATENEAHGTEIWRYDVGAKHEVYLSLVLRNKQ